MFLLLVVAGLLWALPRHDGAHPAAAVKPGFPVVVYNADATCRAKTNRPYACSIGLALDPTRSYDASNVSSHRVWHGDQLTADCAFPGGRVVRAEDGTSSAVWVRVTMDTGSQGHAWLPSVRTRTDLRGLAACP